MQEMKIVYLPPQELVPYAKNAKKHSTKQIDNVALSIQKFGWRQPIVIDANKVIVIGHCRYEAAKKLGLDKVPCVSAEDLTEKQVRELRILDNKLNESEWDYLALNEDAVGLDFSEFDLDGMLGEIDKVEEVEQIDGGRVPDIVEQMNNPRGIKRGQLFMLGEHRLLCGSSTEQRDVDLLMGGQRAPLLFTSPPYAQMREYNGGKDLDVEMLAEFICKYAEYADIQAVNLGLMFRDNQIIPYWDEYIKAAQRCGLKLLAWNVWDKLSCGSIGMQKHMVPVRHEWIFCFGEEPVETRYTKLKKQSSIDTVKTRAVRQPDGSFKTSTRGLTTLAYKKMESVIEQGLPEEFSSMTKQHVELGDIRSKHPATFPVMLPAEYIAAFTSPGDAVIEPFCGSGTTLVACEAMGRKCYGMELDEAYMNVIIDRWEEQTGQRAERIM